MMVATWAEKMQSARPTQIGLALWEVLAEKTVLEVDIEENAGLANLQETFRLPLGTAKQFFAATLTYMKTKSASLLNLLKATMQS